MKRVVITGGSGFIGCALTDELLKVGYEVIWLSRNPDKTRNVPRGVRVEKWDGRTAQGWGALADGAEAIVNLAGESIGIPPIPWTAARKERIRASRVNAGKAIVEAVRAANEKPRVVIQSSAVDWFITTRESYEDCSCFRRWADYQSAFWTRAVLCCRHC